MANPVFDNSPVFGDPRKQKQARGGQATMQQGTAGAQVADAATLDALYAAPSATTRETGRLTYDDVTSSITGERWIR